MKRVSIVILALSVCVLSIGVVNFSKAKENRQAFIQQRHAAIQEQKQLRQEFRQEKHAAMQERKQTRQDKRQLMQANRQQRRNNISN